MTFNRVFPYLTIYLERDGARCGYIEYAPHGTDAERRAARMAGYVGLQGHPNLAESVADFRTWLDTGFKPSEGYQR